MKRSYSFLVEIAMPATLPTFKLYEGRGVQPCDDFGILTKEHPLPKGGKVFKITYTLAPKRGEFVVTQNLGTAIFFEFSDGRKSNPCGGFLNCLIEESDWDNGTRFNRKVEVVKRKKIKGQ
jgi:hypothetical protein